MTRTRFRQLWMIVVGIMLLATSYAYDNSKAVRDKIYQRQKDKDRLNIELRTGSQLTSALVELDGVTLNENKSTRLDILRYLSLENSTYKISTESPVSRDIIGTKVFIRGFKLEAKLPYKEALTQMDFFYNLKKVNLSYVKLSKAEGYGDNVILNLEGSIYGLHK